MATFGRKPKPEPVFVNVYDLHPQNHLIGPVGLGVYHSGVVVHGTEYTFGSGGGIFSHAPKQAQGARFKCSIKVGEVVATSREIERIVESMRPDWDGKNYSLLRQNCNSFSDALSKQLLGHGIPSWINRLSSIGQMCSCLLPSSAQGNAPVSDARPAAAGAGAAKFVGTGNRLGTAGGVELSARPAGAPAASRDTVLAAALRRSQPAECEYVGFVSAREEEGDGLLQGGRREGGRG